MPEDIMQHPETDEATQVNNGIAPQPELLQEPLITLNQSA
jgi:hypothetical protein